MNLLVGQSGGPTAVINGSLYGVIVESLRRPEEIDHVYGMRNGIAGFLQNEYVDLVEQFEDDDELSRLKFTPGAFLGSCRYKLPEDLTDAVYSLLFQKFLDLDIGYVAYIGGNDSMDTVSKLSRYARMVHSSIKFIGIPKTIDNDLALTDHTPGFGSAAKYIATTVREICIDAAVYNKPSVTIIEIMGRNAGWLTASAALARMKEGDNPLLIYLPEIPFDEEKFLQQVKDATLTHTNVVVCVSEGIKDMNGDFVCEHTTKSTVDAFGHQKLTGAAKYLENLVMDRLELKCRSVELNVNQRCSSQNQSRTDLREAQSAAEFGIRKAVLYGETGFMVNFNRVSTHPYILKNETVDVNLVCNVEKKVPLEWIIKDGTDVSKEILDYINPLVHGSVVTPTKNGVPNFVYLKYKQETAQEEVQE